MKNLIFLLKKIFGKKYNIIKSLAKNLHSPIIFFKILFYNLEKDIISNEKNLKKFNVDINEIKETLKKYNISYDDDFISWHYHTFAGFKKIKQIDKILEIGTYDGRFTNYLSHIFPNSKITTIDLPDEDSRFKDSYDRDSKSNLNKFLEKRKLNLKPENISFISVDSNKINDLFEKKSFDLIWIDGDHLNPQVTKDINNSIDLLKDNGFLCCDDVYPYRKSSDPYINCDSYNTLNDLSEKKILVNTFLLKRINYRNAIAKKYITISRKI